MCLPLAQGERGREGQCDSLLQDLVRGREVNEKKKKKKKR